MSQKQEVEVIGPKRKFNLENLKNLINLITGKEDARDRLKPILNPDNLQTSSNLSMEQVEFVTDAHWLAQSFNCFEPLRAFAKELCETKISLEGKGIENAIRYTGAISESQLVKGLIVGPQQEKKGLLHRKPKPKEEDQEE